MRAERKIVLETFTKILSSDNNVSSMQGKPGSKNRSIHVDSQPRQEPVVVRPQAPGPEVLEHPSRKKFSAKYKLQILNEIDSTVQQGEKGAILRREGIYSSNICTWRKQRERGELEGLTPKKRGPKSIGPDPRDKQIKELERQNKRLQRKLAHANLLLDIQKKISEITGIPLAEVEDEEDD